jgi:multiple sugar transport system substrate-binding protein
MMENLEAYTSGQVAMAMNFFAFFPGISRHPRVGQVTGYFSNPPMKAKGATLGGQGMSVVAYSKKQALAEKYLKWFAQPEVQKKWWALGGYSCHKAVLEDPAFESSFPYAKGFKESMQMVHDFWQEPNYGQLLYSTQRLFHKYLVVGEGTPQGTLNQVVKEWNEEFEDVGKIAVQ